MSIKQLSEEYTKKKEEFSKILQQLLTEEIKQNIFDKYPEINSIGTPAYTPYFMDGEPCIYSVQDNPDGVYINNQSLYDYDYDEEPDDETKSFIEAAEKFCEIIRKIPTEIFQDAFQEGLIVFNRDGSVVEQEYEHE